MNGEFDGLRSRPPVVLRRRIAVILALVGCAFAAGCEEDKAAEAPEAKVVMAWKEAGLEVPSFPKLEGDKGLSGSTTCWSGKVSNHVATLCRFPAGFAPEKVRKEAYDKLIGTVTGSVLIRNDRVLAVADPDNVDASGKTIQKILMIFLQQMKQEEGGAAKDTKAGANGAEAAGDKAAGAKAAGDKAAGDKK